MRFHPILVGGLLATLPVRVALADGAVVDLTPFCSSAGCCTEGVCSTPEAKTAAKALRTAIDKTMSFDELVALRPKVDALVAGGKAAFDGSDKAIGIRLRALAERQTANAITGGSLEEVPTLIDRQAREANLDAKWIAGQFASLARRADATSKVKAAPIAIPADSAKPAAAADLETLRTLDARWRAIAATPESARHSETNPAVRAALDKALSTVDASLGVASSRFLKALLGADRFVEAEGLLELDSPRTPSAWRAKSSEAIAQRRANTTMAVDACAKAKAFDVCRQATETVTATCEQLEAMRTPHAGNATSFLERARAAELERRANAPTTPEAFTCNTSARVKLSEALQGLWKAQSSEAIEGAIGAMKLPTEKCVPSANVGWWDGRYCEGISALHRAANAGRSLVKTRATQEIVDKAKAADYGDATGLKDRWSALLGSRWTEEMDKKIASINAAHDAAAEARQECLAECSRVHQRELAACGDDDECVEFTAEHGSEGCWAGCG